MKLFSKFKTYFVYQKQPGQKEGGSSNEVDLKKSTESFELIVADVLDELEEIDSKANDLFEELVYDSSSEYALEESIQNMYVKDYIFVNKYSEGRVLTNEEWGKMISEHNLSLYSKKNVYFSILKGINFSVRKNVWELLANTPAYKKMTDKTYKQLTSTAHTPKSEISIIDKDVPRSKNCTNYLAELRNVLIAYVNFSGREYTQGMNLIAGSLLSLLCLDNDEELDSFEILEKEFEERVFWVFVGIMKHKGWENLFEKDLSGLKSMLAKLEGLMKEHVPKILELITSLGWDLTIFSQYYITILLYNTPRDFSKIILDLFLLDGENIIHSLVIRMMKLQEQKILSIQDEMELMSYFKKDLIYDCFRGIQKDKQNATKLEDFDINFIQSSSE